jgi:hypothetical protein
LSVYAMLFTRVEREHSNSLQWVSRDHPENLKILDSKEYYTISAHTSNNIIFT